MKSRLSKLGSKKNSESEMSCHSHKSTVRTSNVGSAKSESGHNLSFNNESPKGEEEEKSYYDIMMERFNKEIENLPSCDIEDILSQQEELHQTQLAPEFS